MIIDEASLATFPSESLEVHLQSWRAIQVLGEGSMGFSMLLSKDHMLAMSFD
jgi:hypothetical protein